MKMRHKRRVQTVRPVAASVPDALAGTVAVLNAVRHARVALLRNPVALAEIKAQVKVMPKAAGRVLRQMLDADMKLMRQMDRESQRGRAV